MNKFATISASNLDALLRQTNGRWFSVEFIKKSGARRKIVGKLSSKHQLVNVRFPHRTVWDSNPDVFDYRKINLDTTMFVVADKVRYAVI